MTLRPLLLPALVLAITATATVLLLLRFAAPGVVGGTAAETGQFDRASIGAGRHQSRLAGSGGTRLDEDIVFGGVLVVEEGRGQPLAGVVLSQVGAALGPVELGRTSAAGLVNIPAFYSPEEPGELLLRHPGFVTSTIRPERGKLTEVRLVRAGLIVGRLRGPGGGLPPAGVQVVAWPVGHPPRLTAIENREAGRDGLLFGRADAQGDFELPRAAPGTNYVVTASGMGLVAARRAFVRGASRARLELDLLPAYLVLVELGRGTRLLDDRLAEEAATWTAEPELHIVTDYGLFDPEFAILGLVRDQGTDRTTGGAKGRTRNVALSGRGLGGEVHRRLAGFLFASRVEAAEIGPIDCSFFRQGKAIDGRGLQAVRLGPAALDGIIDLSGSARELTRLRVDFFNRPPELAVAGDFIAAPFGRLRFKDADSGVEFECPLQESDLDGFELDGFPVGRFEVRGLLETQRSQAESETFWTGRLDSRSERELVVTVPDRVCSLRGELPEDATFAVLALRRISDSSRGVAIHLTRTARFVIPAIAAGEYRLRARIERAGETISYEARVLIDAETRIGRLDPASFERRRSR